MAEPCSGFQMSTGAPCDGALVCNRKPDVSLSEVSSMGGMGCRQANAEAGGGEWGSVR